MKVAFMSSAWAGYLYWQKTDKKQLTRINRLIEECRRTPFEGSGHPEPLKHDLAGWWSRRIDREHRLVYRVKDNTLEIAQCRFHY